MRAGDSRMEADHHHHEDERSAEAGHRRHRWKGPPYNDRQRSSPWVWMAVILCMLLAIGVLVLGATMLAVYFIYKPQMPYMEVTNAQLLQLDYSPADGVIRDIKFKFDLLAKNTNSKVDTSFSSFSIDVNFNGTTLLQLSAETFSVARKSSVTLPYSGESRRARLDPAGMQAMDEALKSELVPIEEGRLPQGRLLDAPQLPPRLLLPHRRRRAHRPRKLPLQVAVAHCSSSGFASPSSSARLHPALLSPPMAYTLLFCSLLVHSS
ncbi:hypothetical protein CFC21_110497 [Triticum aestivum]|uniref:Late embryogenesis abundant protein LEA-2 subgroup domain-containing protein n=3 Tax=Triticinae TaxID=1648030 RepID=A0A453SJJ2_AEGTS|nr:hypothetical protein CFC21_110497 [Triticum aestivum]